MSNNLNTPNSRFASLIEKKDIEKEIEHVFKEEKRKHMERKEPNFNSFKSRHRDIEPSSGNRNTCFRPYDEKERFTQQQKMDSQKLMKEKEKDKKRQALLTIDNFPDLLVISKPDNISDHKLNYMEQIKKEIIHTIEPELVAPGWMTIKRDRLTGVNTIKYNNSENNRLVKTTHEEIVDGLNVLLTLHEKRTSDYIDLYGYDTWENMYKGDDYCYYEDEDDEDSVDNESINNESTEYN
jgi:hypothetical protein